MSDVTNPLYAPTRPNALIAHRTDLRTVVDFGLFSVKVDGGEHGGIYQSAASFAEDAAQHLRRYGVTWDPDIRF